jgi:hypothetical protein
MRYLSSHRRLLFILLVLLILFIPSPSCSAQDENTRILNEISRDWSTNIILIFVETPNKSDRTYATNITDKAVLDEMSAIEEAMDPQKDDYGEQDDITFVLSISSLIKEINIAPKNIEEAMEQEFGVDIPIDVPGEYKIPDNQEDIDRIVGQIPDDTLKLLVIDTNNDGIWDSTVILIGTIDHDTDILGKIDGLIDQYYIDPGVSSSDYNSRDNWWRRLDSAEIHCAMTNLGYVESYEYYRSSDLVDLWLPIIVIVILVGLLILLFLKIKPKTPKKIDEVKMKNKFLPMIIIFLILIGACLPFFFIKTSSESVKLTQLYEEFHGGQVGLVLVRGNPAPGPGDEDQRTNGRGSMKDFEVLDDINDLERELKKIDDPPINPSISVVDIMKMIKVPESIIVRIPIDLLPPNAQDLFEQLINTSFWDVISNADDDETSTWYVYYGKSMQDSMINIFYNSITIEMRSILVNHDFSKSLIYLQIPMMDEEKTEEVLNRINRVVENYPAGRSTTRAVLVESGSIGIQNIIGILKMIVLFVVLVIGIITFIIFYQTLQRGNKGDKQESQAF